MNKVAYDKNRILHVTQEGLEYLADDGSKCFIDFKACRENFQREHRDLGGQGVKYIGFRDFGARPPHIILFTDPPTKFEFPMPKKREILPGAKFIRSDPDDYRDFMEFRMRLDQAGWATGDLA